MNRILKSKEIEARRISGELTKKEAKKLDAELWANPPKGSLLAKIIGLTITELVYGCKELISAWIEFNKEEKEKGNPDAKLFPFTTGEAWSYLTELIYRGLNWLLWMQLAVSSLCFIRELQGKSNPSFLESVNWVGNPLIALIFIGILRVTLGVSVLFKRTDKNS